jgi:hypothetical protein
MNEAIERIDEFSEIFRQFGALILPGLMKHDDRFVRYESDLKQLLVNLAEDNGLRVNRSDCLDQLITAVAPENRTLVGAIYDIGTRPIKLLSGNRLKTHPFVMSFLEAVFGDSTIACPYLGETLHVFPPGEENEKYNLPIHQDYPYLMQSDRQVTAYFNFGHRRSAEMGGVRFWLCSHKGGVSRARRSELGHWESVLESDFQERYQHFDYVFDNGDFALFDSLLQHSGIKNKSSHTRVVQLIRYSGLTPSNGIAYRWQSAQRDGRGVSFPDEHPELVVEEKK